MIRDLASQTTDEVLFALSYDFVGDLAETVSLLWPSDNHANDNSFTLSDIVETLQSATC